jgi:hypothetical protein
LSLPPLVLSSLPSHPFQQTSGKWPTSRFQFTHFRSQNCWTQLYQEFGFWLVAFEYGHTSLIPQTTFLWCLSSLGSYFLMLILYYVSH